MSSKNHKAEIIDFSEEMLEQKETLGLSQGQIVLKRFLRHRAAMVSLVVLISIVLFVFTAGGLALGTLENPIRIMGWWIWDFTDIAPIENNGVPTLDVFPEFIDGTGMQVGLHPFGQDLIGQDYFSLVVRGAQQSITVMFVIGIVAAFIGTTLGAISGFFGKWIDQAIMRFTDLIITIPALIVGAVIGATIGNLGVFFLALFLGLFTWTGLARLVRGEFLSLREREFVDAARVAGASNRRIIFKHILPNAMGVIIVSVSLLMSSAILLETALSFLGFGVVSPDTSLGTLISANQDSFTVFPWLFWWPGLFIVTIALCVNFIGDGLRDAFDPRQKRKISKKDREIAKAAKAKSVV
jgi:ABC-type dipeptide/oligopeptide/nickel transport system permease subunit